MLRGWHQEERLQNSVTCIEDNLWKINDKCGPWWEEMKSKMVPTLCNYPRRHHFIWCEKGLSDEAELPANGANEFLERDASLAVEERENQFHAIPYVIIPTYKMVGKILVLGEQLLQTHLADSGTLEYHNYVTRLRIVCDCSSSKHNLFVCLPFKRHRFKPDQSE